MLNRELGEQLFELLLAAMMERFGHLERRANVVLDGQTAKNRRFLGKVANAEARPAVHRQARDVVPVHRNRAVVRGDQAGHAIEAGCFAGAVGAKQRDGLAALYRQTDVAQYRPLTKGFSEATRDKAFVVRNEPRSTFTGLHVNLSHRSNTTLYHAGLSPRFG